MIPAVFTTKAPPTRLVFATENSGMTAVLDPAITPTLRFTGTETMAPPITHYTAAKGMEPCLKCLAPGLTALRVLDPPLTSATLPTALELVTETGELITHLVRILLLFTVFYKTLVYSQTHISLQTNSSLQADSNFLQSK